MNSERILEDLELWIAQQKNDYEHGGAMSLAESMYGLNAIKDTIYKVEELKRKYSTPMSKINTVFYEDGFLVACECDPGEILDTTDGIEWNRRSE